MKGRQSVARETQAGHPIIWGRDDEGSRGQTGQRKVVLEVTVDSRAWWCTPLTREAEVCVTTPGSFLSFIYLFHFSCQAPVKTHYCRFCAFFVAQKQTPPLPATSLQPLAAASGFCTSCRKRLNLVLSRVPDSSPGTKPCLSSAWNAG